MESKVKDTQDDSNFILFHRDNTVGSFKFLTKKSGEYTEVVIPAFDITFSTMNHDAVKDKVKAMIECYLIFMIEKRGILFVSELACLGFRQKGYELKMVWDVKLSPNVTPSGFYGIEDVGIFIDSGYSLKEEFYEH